MLRSAQLGSAYEQAWESWAAPGDDEAWEAVAADGLGGWMHRGEIVAVSLDPAVGPEASKPARSRDRLAHRGIRAKPLACQPRRLPGRPYRARTYREY